MRRKRTQIQLSHDEFNIWSAFTDLMANAFMILSFFLLLTFFKSVVSRSTAETAQTNLSDAQDKIEQLEKEKASLNQQLQQKSFEITQLNKKGKAPPVVIIENSGDYKFSSGSAELNPKLKQFVSNNLVNMIERIAKEQDLYVIEIIGHTDGQVNVGGFSNLDTLLERVANNDSSLNDLRPASNADLGLMRALAVVKTLQEIQNTGRLQGLQFRAYSAAQLLLLNGKFAPINRSPEAQRRRIEIRFSPLGQAQIIK
ncbi:MAG: flagellar motor protein [Crocosphaera sp.]|nr:flagellar motor protein [Crocosphaera sp.]